MHLVFEKRPVCSCGVKMKLIEYKGYYEEFRYWECQNCTLEKEMHKSGIKPDISWKGSYR